MLSNIFLVSGIITVAVVFSMFGYNYYYDISQAKQIQQTYDTIAEIKKILAKQYNKNPDEITRDEIIAILPKGKNWEKLFLSNQNDSLVLDSNSIIDNEVKIVLSQEDKLKLFALKTRLNNMSDFSDSIEDTSSNTIKFPVSKQEKTRLDSVNVIKKEVAKVKEILSFTTKTLSEVLTNQAYSDSEKKDILYYLKKDLENSKNSLDLNLYKNRITEINTIEASL